MTESCAVNYCQDGLQVYFATETLQNPNGQIYGHYELQPNDVNGRPYFKMGLFGLWYSSGINWWWIGLDIEKGQSYGYANYDTQVFCPHQISEWGWMVFDGVDVNPAGYDLGITCKWICSQTKP